MSVIKFVATKLPSNKIGKITPDTNGYYPLQIGAMNVYNAAREYYIYQGAAEKLFNESSSFMRRVSNGCLKSEVGHPRYIPGMSEKDYIRRMIDIDEKNVCAHIKEVRLDFSNKNYIGIIGLVKPAGPKADALAGALENPDENVCFSVRGVTDDYIERGQTYRILRNIITWDWVNEPGIAPSTKWSSPALEDLVEIKLSKIRINSMIEDKSLIATESSNLILRETVSYFEDTKLVTPNWKNW